jgi:hypothetical protein
MKNRYEHLFVERSGASKHGRERSLEGTGLAG